MRAVVAKFLLLTGLAVALVQPSFAAEANMFNELKAIPGLSVAQALRLAIIADPDNAGVYLAQAEQAAPTQRTTLEQIAAQAESQASAAFGGIIQRLASRIAQGPGTTAAGSGGGQGNAISQAVDALQQVARAQTLQDAQNAANSALQNTPGYPFPG